jgi:DNA-directed RNA polymerase specialized sigma24 family protein
MDSLKTFCEFPSIGESQDYLTWHRDPQLARYLSGFEDRSLAQIADVLVNRICSNPTDKLACGCITALLAHILFSASGRAKIRTQIFNPLQHHSTQIELEDVYQIALDIICQPGHFLANFQPDPVNWYGSLVRYSNYRFDRLLIDRIRSLPELSGFKRTNLGLLARTSPRRIEIALTQQGEKDLRLEQLLLLHQCLVDVVGAGGFDTKNPQPVHYDNLSARYLEQCDGLVDVAIDDALCAARGERATLIQLVAYMGTAIRNYLQPRSDALDRSIGNNDAEGTALIDIIPDPSHRQQRLESGILKQDVIELSAKLAIDSDRLLMFFYGLDLTQQEVGIELDCHQTTAKHRRDRCFKQLAKDLHAKIFRDEDLSIELLDVIIDALATIYEDIYPELLLEILALAIADVKILEPSIIELFIDCLQQRWEFNFKPSQMGLIKATNFVSCRATESHRLQAVGDLVR